MGRKQRLKKQKQKEQTAKLQAQQYTAFYWIIFAGLGILMFYPPYFRGLFFDKEFLPTHIYTAAVFGLWLVYKFVHKKERFIRTPVDYTALALVTAYLISLFAAVNLRFAVGELLKYINYFMVFYLVSDIAKDLKKSKILLNIMLASAVGVAVIGIGAAAGTFTYNGAFVGGRINSTLQYPNTLAAYLTSAFAISMVLLLTAENKWLRHVYTLSNFILFFTFIFTFSRAAWLFFPIFLIILIAGLGKGLKAKAAGYFLLTLVVSLVCIPGFGSAIAKNAGSKAWMWFFTGIGLTALLSILTQNVFDKINISLNRRILIPVCVILLLLLSAGITAALKTEAPLTLSHSADEKPSWKGIYRSIGNIKPDTEYKLTFFVKGENKGEQPYTYNVRVAGINKNGESVYLLNKRENAGPEFEKKEFVFRTREDTQKINIYFYNYYTNTSATFKEANLINTQDSSETKRVILKYKFIPENIIRRAASIKLTDTSAGGRFTFYKDAFKIIKDHPIIGTGGGGWKASYKSYQSHLYWTTEVHSGFLQTWVETGTVGFLALTALWLAVAFSVFRFIKGDSKGEYKTLIWGMFSGALAIGGHSIIDFNLSLGAVSLYLWELFGLITAVVLISEPNTAMTKARTKSSYKAITAVIILLIIIFTGFSLLQGYNYGQKAVKSLKNKDITGAMEAFEKASKYDPLTASFRADLGQIYNVVGRQTGSKELKEKALKELEKAVRLDSYNPELRVKLGGHYLETGKIEQGLDALEKAVELQPYNIKFYEYLSDAYKGVGALYIKNGMKDKAQDLFKRARALLNSIEEANLKTDKKMKITNKVMLNVQKADLLAQNIDDRRYYKKIDDLAFISRFDIDTDQDGLPDLWRKSDSKDGYLEVKINKKPGGGFVRINNKGKGTSYLLTTEDFSLKPQNLYKLKLTARGSVKPASVRIDVLSRTGKTNQLTVKSVPITSEFTEIEETFLTTKDIEPGKQWLRIMFLGNEEGYIDIQSIEIWCQ